MDGRAVILHLDLMMEASPPSLCISGHGCMFSPMCVCLQCVVAEGSLEHLS